MSIKYTTSPITIAEGRIIYIDIDAQEAGKNIYFLDEALDDPPVVIIFTDRKTGMFIKVFDHRAKSREALKQNVQEFFRNFQLDVPCLCGFRQKNHTRYIVLADIGTQDMLDGGEAERYALTKSGKFNCKLARILCKGLAIHAPTKICLVSPRS